MPWTVRLCGVTELRRAEDGLCHLTCQTALLKSLTLGLLFQENGLHFIVPILFGKLSTGYQLHRSRMCPGCWSKYMNTHATPNSLWTFSQGQDREQKLHRQALQTVRCRRVGPPGAARGVEWRLGVESRPYGWRGGGGGEWTRQRTVPGEVGRVLAVILRVVNKTKGRGTPVDNRETSRRNTLQMPKGRGSVLQAALPGSKHTPLPGRRQSNGPHPVLPQLATPTPGRRNSPPRKSQPLWTDFIHWTNLGAESGQCDHPLNGRAWGKSNSYTLVVKWCSL